MKEHPILFSSEMVRAILDGRKTQTRRIINPQPIWKEKNGLYAAGWSWQSRGGACKYSCFEELDFKKVMIEEQAIWEVGDRLWVRETHARWSNEHDNIIYCDNPEYIQLGQQNKLLVEVARKSQECSDLMECVGHWVKVPSIFMPKWACRIFLEITNIRVERVQDISGEDAQEEGWPRDRDAFPTINTNYKSKRWFHRLWDSLNAKRGYGWDKNPWCWVIEFKKL